MRRHTLERPFGGLAATLLLTGTALLLLLLLAGCAGDGGAVAVEPDVTASPTGGASDETPRNSDGEQPASEASQGQPIASTPNVAPDTESENEATDGDSSAPLPFLIDLGATKCIPCKLMAPILEELAETKSDYFEVIFYDVWEDRSKGQEFGIRAIPTQIFFSARGEELFRHEGYFSRNQILGKWRDLGIDVGE